MKQGLLGQLLAARTERRAVALVTELATGDQRLVTRGEAASDPLAAVLDQSFRFDQSGVHKVGESEYFLQINNPTLRLILIGAVHIAQAVIPIARGTGYAVTVIDPRGAFATGARFPGIALYPEWPDEILPRIGLDARTAMIALTHDPKIDDPALTAALRSDVFYIGALGSKKTQASRRERLAANGFTTADFQRIHGPIGLDIGAKGAPEIAISIMAEMTAYCGSESDVKFGRIALDEAEGAILAHSVRHATGLFKKGRILSAADLKLLRDAGVENVYAARLEADDVAENEAAGTIARAVAGVGAIAQEPFTGRANLHAQASGLVVIDADRVRQLNRLHESLTLATAANHEKVEGRQMVATVKVIPFSVPRSILTRALAIIGDEPVVRVEAFRPRHAGLIVTRLPQTKPSLIAKSEASIRARIGALGGSVDAVVVCDHAVEPIKDAVSKLHARRLNPILIFGSSAIVDRGDVIPQGLVAAGGEVVHLGMPVDPGNLLMLGRLDGVSAIGVPSCARSPKVNGFDWVLERVMAGLHLTAQDIMDMGAGGLLKEIPSRPAPREDTSVQKAPIIAAIVLAAGKSTRMGQNKMLADFRGKPLIRVTVETILKSTATPVLVVTGNQGGEVAEALKDLDVAIADNPDYAQGLSTSLRVGLAALPADVAGAVVCLGDMPLIEPAVIDRLIAAFNPAEGRLICAPTYDGKMGNPMLWGRAFFAEMSELSGDRGARSLLDAHNDQLVEIPVADDAVLTDIDTPDVLERLRSTSTV